ncbi:MAG: glycosyltransferase family 2 protein [Desulfovibrio sp.]|nr:glycosyltransferase family 2 protein [Desulfovibrio sp.]
MLVHVGIVTWNRLSLTKLCLESLLELTRTDFKCTVVDNGSTDGTVDYLLQMQGRYAPKIRVKRLRRNMGVSVASNLAWAAEKEADFFVKLDNDVEIRDPDWLGRLLDLSKKRPDLAPLGFQLCPWHEGSGETLADGTRFIKVSCCNGACALIPRAVHEQLGFWNEGYGVYGYEDLEYSWRALRAGFQPVYLAGQEALLHHGLEPERYNQRQEAIKLESRTAKLHGTKAYLLYLFLFEQGLLPLRMERKYLAKEVDGFYHFTLNPAHKQLQKMIQNLVKTVEVTTEGNLARLDLSKWQSKT